MLHISQLKVRNKPIPFFIIFSNVILRKIETCYYCKLGGLEALFQYLLIYTEFKQITIKKLNLTFLLFGTIKSCIGIHRQQQRDNFSCLSIVMVVLVSPFLHNLSNLFSAYLSDFRADTDFAVGK